MNIFYYISQLLKSNKMSYIDLDTCPECVEKRTYFITIQELKKLRDQKNKILGNIKRIRAWRYETMYDSPKFVQYTIEINKQQNILNYLNKIIAFKQITLDVTRDILNSMLKDLKNKDPVNYNHKPLFDILKEING
jgi:uncharacterized coiled-coil protein SlyX